MTISLHGLATALQTLLTNDADTAAKESGFIARKRKISGAGFVQTLVFVWMSDPPRNARRPCRTALGVALFNRSTSGSTPKPWTVSNASFGRRWPWSSRAGPETIPLLRRFTEVVLEDSTSVRLPASLAGKYPGCGGSSPEAGKASLKVMAHKSRSSPARVRLIEPAAGRRVGPHIARILAAAAAGEPPA